jgi:hypothetical protein
LANKFNLAGKTNLERAYVEMYAEQIRDLFEIYVLVLFEKDEKKKVEDETRFFDKILPNNLGFFEKKLIENESGFLIGDSLTWVDLFLFFSLDFIGENKVKDSLENASNVRKHIEKIANYDGILEYLKNRPRTEL